ncbi:MAG: alpha/beta fold hydrolase [Pseudomonadota bacterium]
MIYGEEDKNGTPKNAADLHGRLPDSTLLMLPNAGHFVIREKEDEVLDAISGFATNL